MDTDANCAAVGQLAQQLSLLHCNLIYRCIIFTNKSTATTTNLPFSISISPLDRQLLGKAADVHSGSDFGLAGLVTTTRHTVTHQRSTLFAMVKDNGGGRAKSGLTVFCEADQWSNKPASLLIKLNSVVSKSPTLFVFVSVFTFFSSVGNYR